MLHVTSAKRQKIRCQKDIGHAGLVDILTFLVGRQDTRGGSMKITRTQLRRLIETTIKPNIPNVPSEDALEKIDVLSRSDDHRLQADSLASAFDYPEDRSYSDDLRTYDDSGRIGPAIQQMRALGTSYADAETHGEPEEYYFRRDALKKAAEICDSFDMSLVKLLIDSFTDAANDYEEKRAKRMGLPDPFGIGRPN